MFQDAGLEIVLDQIILSAIGNAAGGKASFARSHRKTTATSGAISRIRRTADLAS